MRPKFDTLWTQPWPYSEQDGVGLRIEGLPIDASQFIKYLAEQSCHPAASQRILNAINAQGYALLTVMARLDFDAIGRALWLMGVTLNIIEPRPDLIVQHSDGAYPALT